MSFAELIDAGLVNVQNCTLIDKVTDRVVAIKDISQTSASEDALTSARRASVASLKSDRTNDSTLPTSATILTSNEPNFPSVLTITNQEYSHDRAKLTTKEVRLLHAYLARLRTICRAPVCSRVVCGWHVC